jgi:hypothetical protein
VIVPVDVSIDVHFTMAVTDNLEEARAIVASLKSFEHVSLVYANHGARSIVYRFEDENVERECFMNSRLPHIEYVGHGRKAEMIYNTVVGGTGAQPHRVVLANKVPLIRRGTDFWYD